MTLAPVSPAEDALGRLAKRFAQWRASRATSRGRIPPPLWEQAVALTQVLPRARVAKRLGLCPKKLKKRCEVQPNPTGDVAPLHFVEVAAAGSARPSTTEVDVQRTDGARLRLTYRDANPALVPLVQTFLETR